METFIFEHVHIITTSIEFFFFQRPVADRKKILLNAIFAAYPPSKEFSFESEGIQTHFHIFNDDDDNECEPVEHFLKDSTDEDDQSDAPGCDSDDEFSDQEIDETESDEVHEEETTEIENYSKKPDEATRTTILK
jgi:hypothetical protein